MAPGTGRRQWTTSGLARTSLCDRTLQSLEQRARVLEGLLETAPVDVLFSVLEAPDRLQHVYYRYMDPSDDLYSSAEAARARPAIARCFAAMDRIVGLLEDYAGADGGVVVCSDHGFTSWQVSVHTNALLAQWGYLSLKGSARAMQTGAVRKLIPVAKRFLPRKLARVKGRTFGSIDWPSPAFASPIPHQGSSEPPGRRPTIPSTGDSRRQCRSRACFEQLTAPDGGLVPDRVYNHGRVDGEHSRARPRPTCGATTATSSTTTLHTDPYRLSHCSGGAQECLGRAGPGVARPETSRVRRTSSHAPLLGGLALPEGLTGGAWKMPSRRTRSAPIRWRRGPTIIVGEGRGRPLIRGREAIIEESLRGLGTSRA